MGADEWRKNTLPSADKTLGPSCSGIRLQLYPGTSVSGPASDPARHLNMADVDDDTILVVAAIAVASVAALAGHRLASFHQSTGVPSRESDKLRGRAWLLDCMSNPQQLYDETRLQPVVFNSLADSLRARKLVRDGRRVSVEEKLLSFLYICGNGASWRNTQYKNGHALHTISR